MSKSRFLSIFIPVFLILATIPGIRGQELVEEGIMEVNDTVVSVTDSIMIQTEEPLLPDSIGRELTLPEYQAWNKVSINGKLKMAGLPLSPGVKIFMEKDSSVFISIRAPFFGEVGRIEINNETLFAVNKMKKTYTEEPIEDFLKYFPGDLGDIQELILGRIVIPGVGLLTEETADAIEVIDNGEELFVIPVEEVAIKGVDYGYIIDADFIPQVLLVVPEENRDIAISLGFGFDRKSYAVTFSFQYGNRGFEAALELDSPDWENGEPPAQVKLDKKYRKLSLQDFIRSF